MSFRKVIQRQLARFGWKLSRVTPLAPSAQDLRPDLDMLIAVLLAKRGRATFVQVGANNGQRDDPLRSWLETGRLSGLFVEPQPAPMEELQALYRNQPVLQYHLGAVSDRSGTMTLHVLREDYASRVSRPVAKTGFNHQVSSFDPAHILRHIGFDGDPDEVLEQVEVPVERLDDLMVRHGLGLRPDICVMDTEGHDDVILLSLDLAEFHPSILCLEAIHLSQDRLAQCVARLTGAGYAWCFSGIDLLAADRGFLSSHSQVQGVADLSGPVPGPPPKGI